MVDNADDVEAGYSGCSGYDGLMKEVGFGSTDDVEPVSVLEGE